MKKVVLPAAAAVLVAAAVAYHLAGDAAPNHQPALATLDTASLDQLRAQFNAASRESRVILLLSPT